MNSTARFLSSRRRVEPWLAPTRLPAHPGFRLTAALAILAAGLAFTLAGCAGRTAERTLPELSFASLIDSLSEPNRYFDTDNLITNESSYLHVISTIEAADIRGGAYIGVGPAQNFSYLARIRPEIAFLVDIRRDNLLQHLLFKTLFQLSRNRLEYLATLLGRPLPPDLAAWDDRSIAELVDYIDRTELDEAAGSAAQAGVYAVVQAFGLALSDDDLKTIGAFHREFMTAGLSLKFRSHGRAPRFYYPTLRDLLLERDLAGRRTSYLASEEDFQFVKELQARDHVVPVVGDLGGDKSLRSIGQYLQRRELKVSAFYTSNVEYYLHRERRFPAFIRNLQSLPYDDRSVIIRSVFHSVFGPHPRAVPGHISTQVVQSIAALTEGVESGRYRGYWDVVTLDTLD
jgi:hypothetical protein